MGTDPKEMESVPIQVTTVGVSPQKGKIFKMKDLYEKIYKLIKAGKNIVLATIYNSSGSSPRTSGAKMIILEDGSIFGTIGGGRMEAGVQQKAKEIFKRRQYEILQFSLKGIKDTDMICGGDVQILLEYMDAAEEQTQKIYEQSEKCVKNSENAIFITEITKGTKSTAHYVFSEKQEENINKEIDSRILESLRKDSRFRSLKCIAFDDKIFILEPVYLNDKVYIFGAGHVSKKLAELTKLVEFQTIVLDDREEFANRDRFPLSDKVMVLDSFDDPFKDISIDSESYMVIVTRGHETDFKVLRKALKSKAGYIGMMGSRRKRIELFKKLEMEGFTEEDFKRVHCPIGIEIYAETPEEIAVSIAAELIKVRSGK